jgi:major type 1 subunit fimbrin (pilin)
MARPDEEVNHARAFQGSPTSVGDTPGWSISLVWSYPMMNSKLGAAIAAIAIGSVAGSPTAMAANGTITFNGEIGSVTCDVGGGGSNTPNFTVTLPKVGTNSFQQVGDTSAATPYAIRVGGPDEPSCPEGTKIAIFHEITSAQIDPITGNLSLTSSSGATGVQLQILQSNQPIDLRTGQRTEAEITNGSATIPFAVRYIATAAAPTPGSANSQVLYTVAYL